MATITVTMTTPVYRPEATSGVFVQWRVDSADNETYTYSLERSIGSEGPFEMVFPTLFDPFAFDEHPNPYNLLRTTYYRVTATDTAGNTVSTVRLVDANLQGRNVGLHRKLQRDIRVGFKFNAIDLAILKRLQWGKRCPVCYDATTKRVLKNKCNVCYGTSFERGFADPIYVRGRIGVDQVKTQIANMGRTEVNNKRLTLLTVPQLEKYDIVVDLAQQNRYEITQAFGTELQTVKVHQVAYMSELARDSIQYQIPVDHLASPDRF